MAEPDPRPGPADELAAAAGELEDAFGRLVVQHRRTVMRQAEAVSPGLALGAMKAFVTVCHHGRMTPSALADHLLMDRGQVSRTVRELEGLGLVSRSQDPEDRRQTLVTPTEGGLARLDRARGGAPGEGLRRALSGWEPDEVRALATLLRRFVAGWGDEPPVTR